MVMEYSGRYRRMRKPVSKLEDDRIIVGDKNNDMIVILSYWEAKEARKKGKKK